MIAVEGVSLSFVALNAFFGGLLLAWARLVLGQRGSPILWAFVFVSVVFVYAIPRQDYSSDVSLDLLLLSHLLIFVFQAFVLLLGRRYAARMEDLLSAILRVPTAAFWAVVLAWLLWRLQLIIAHGPAALSFSRAHYAQLIGAVELSTLEVALSSTTSMFLIGGIAFLLVCHAAGQQGRSLFAYVTALVMLVFVVLTNESPIGSRRILFVLAALWFTVRWLGSRSSLVSYLSKHSKQVAMILLLTGGAAAYYQNIRNNDISSILAAQGLSEVVAATFEFLTTVDGQHDESDVQYLRSGPFDFFAKVLATSVVEGKSSGGEATLFSLALSVPKAIYLGVKPVGDVDEILFRHLEIYPSVPTLNIDYSTSLPAIGLADFGPIGVLLASVVLGGGFVAVGRVLAWTQTIALAPLLMLGVSVQLIGSQETGLTAIVSVLRDAAIALVFLVVVHQMVRITCRVCRHVSGRLSPAAVEGRLTETWT